MSKYKAGDKFIIEIDDVLYIESAGGLVFEPWYMVNGLEGTYFEDDDLDSLERCDGDKGVWNAGYKTGYDKGYQEGALNPSSIGYEHGYEAGLNDAWECARKIIAMEWKDKHEALNDPSMFLTDMFDNISALEAIEKLREYGYEARRGQQFSGANGDPDVVTNMGHIHIECKVTANGHGSTYDWIDQAKRDKKPDEIPVVMHKKVSKEYRGYKWLVTMTLDDFMKIWSEYDNA